MICFVVMRNDTLLGNRAFTAFEDAADMAFAKTGVCPLTANHLYAVGSMDYVIMHRLELVGSSSESCA